MSFVYLKAPNGKETNYVFHTSDQMTVGPLNVQMCLTWSSKFVFYIDKLKIPSSTHLGL